MQDLGHRDPEERSLASRAQMSLCQQLGRLQSSGMYVLRKSAREAGKKDPHVSKKPPGTPHDAHWPGSCCKRCHGDSRNSSDDEPTNEFAVQLGWIQNALALNLLRGCGTDAFH